MSPIYWLPWVILVMVILVWHSSRHAELADASEEAFEGGGFWSRVRDIQIEDLHRLDRMMKELENDKEHPQKMMEYEEYFDSQLGISK